MKGNQEIFVEEYCNNGENAAEAYKKAYPECKSGHRQNGYRLLTYDYIKDAITKTKTVIKEWKEGGRELCDRLFSERYAACVAKGDNTNAIRCIENKSKNVGYYAVDNAQRVEETKLNDAEATECRRIANIINIEEAKKGKVS